MLHMIMRDHETGHVVVERVQIPAGIDERIVVTRSFTWSFKPISIQRPTDSVSYYTRKQAYSNRRSPPKREFLGTGLTVPEEVSDKLCLRVVCSCFVYTLVGALGSTRAMGILVKPIANMGYTDLPYWST